MKRKALIIDDHPDIGAMCAIYLAEAGFETRYCADGNQGLREASEFRPDIAVVDLMMPRVHGYEVCERLRADPRTKECRILVITSKVFGCDMDLARAAGADDYLTKPFIKEEFLSRAERILTPLAKREIRS